MEEFLKSISTASTHPLALAAYSIAAVLFLLAGKSLTKLRLVLNKINTVSPEERKSIIEIATETKLPAAITPEQWIKITRMRMVYYLTGALLICVTAVTVVALTTKSEERPNFQLNEIKP